MQWLLLSISIVYTFNIALPRAKYSSRLFYSPSHSLSLDSFWKFMSSPFLLQFLLDYSNKKPKNKIQNAQDKINIGKINLPTTLKTVIFLDCLTDFGKIGGKF